MNKLVSICSRTFLLYSGQDHIRLFWYRKSFSVLIFVHFTDAGGKTMRARALVGLAAFAFQTAGIATAAVVSYGTVGSTYQETFDVLSSTAAPTTGYGWQQGAPTSNNTGLNSPTGTAGIAGVYVFASGLAGAAPDLALGGSRNFTGPDGVPASSWAGAANYFA